MRRARVVKRIAAVAAAVWVGRWAAQVLAAYAGRHWHPRAKR